MKRIAIAAAIGIAAFLAGCASPGVLSGSEYLAAIAVARADVSSLPDGIYKGSSKVAIPLGSIAAYPRAEVEVTVSGGRYSAITVSSPKSIGQNAEFVDFANRMIAAQSPAVDGVSGASFTSKAVQLAVVKAVTK